MFVFENTLFRMISDANISKILILHINFQSFFCHSAQKSVFLTQQARKKMYLIHPNCQKQRFIKIRDCIHILYKNNNGTSI